MCENNNLIILNVEYDMNVLYYKNIFIFFVFHYKKY